MTFVKRFRYFFNFRGLCYFIQKYLIAALFRFLTQHKPNWSKIDIIILIKVFCHHYIFIISQLWLTSHLRSTVVPLDTGTSGVSREIYSEDADGETRTHNPSVINRVL